jgi:ankyrin repeat protein
MGKSLILDNWTQGSSGENFFMKIVLNTCKEALSDKSLEEKLKVNNNKTDVIDYIFRSLLNKSDEQEISLLKHVAREERLILMFDGLDEVTDYKKQVIALIDALDKDMNYRVKKIVITTRNHLKLELEDHFKTFSFDLNNFSNEDQKSFLYKYWRSSNLRHQERATSAKLRQSADDLIIKLKSILSENISDLIGIPLQSKMLADIFVDKQKDFSTLEIANVAELYQHFLETKIRIKFEEKSDVKIGQLPKKLRQLFELAKNDFFSDHSKLSYTLLFEQENEIGVDDDEKIQEILEYGVVCEFKGNKTPTFLHQSFAEFFVAKSSIQKIEQNNAENDKELEQILLDKRHFLIRKFLNDLLMNGHLNSRVKETNKNQNDFKQEIKNCYNENLVYLLKYLIDGKGASLRTIQDNKFFIRAALKGRKELVAYLIEKEIDTNQQDNSGCTALMFAAIEGHKEIVQILLEHESTNANLRELCMGTTALINACKYGYKEIVQLLLDHKNIQVNQYDHQDRTALINASEKGHQEIVRLLLDHRDIQVNQQDEDGRTALMYASEKGHQEIEQMLVLFQSLNNTLPEKLSDRIVRRQENDVFLNQSLKQLKLIRRKLQRENSEYNTALDDDEDQEEDVEREKSEYDATSDDDDDDDDDDDEYKDGIYDGIGDVKRTIDMIEDKILIRKYRIKEEGRQLEEEQEKEIQRLKEEIRRVEEEQEEEIRRKEEEIRKNDEEIRKNDEEIQRLEEEGRILKEENRKNDEEIQRLEEEGRRLKEENRRKDEEQEKEIQRLKEEIQRVEEENRRNEVLEANEEEGPK